MCLIYFRIPETFQPISSYKGFKIEICRWLGFGHDSWTIHKQQGNYSYYTQAIFFTKDKESVAVCIHSLDRKKMSVLLRFKWPHLFPWLVMPLIQWDVVNAQKIWYRLFSAHKICYLETPIHLFPKRFHITSANSSVLLLTLNYLINLPVVKLDWQFDLAWNSDSQPS